MRVCECVGAVRGYGASKEDKEVKKVRKEAQSLVVRLLKSISQESVPVQIVGGWGV